MVNLNEPNLKPVHTTDLVVKSVCFFKHMSLNLPFAVLCLFDPTICSCVAAIYVMNMSVWFVLMCVHTLTRIFVNHSQCQGSKVLHRNGSNSCNLF